jgi:hypothetical protein
MVPIFLAFLDKIILHNDPKQISNQVALKIHHILDLNKIE